MLKHYVLISSRCNLVLLCKFVFYKDSSKHEKVVVGNSAHVKGLVPESAEL